MAKIYISVGSNIEPESNIRQGVQQLQALFEELEISSIYLSEAIGFDGGDFYNFVIGAETSASIADVSLALREVEIANGRLPNAVKFSSRTLDLDLLLYDDVICQEPVRLPRSEIAFNAFVLWPLAEIAPDVIHPELNESMLSLWNKYDKSAQVLRPITFNWDD
ncbi:2-amino-4-hydroxy-6-hydroxymethyldihydropteridine diphosphokinase [Shewanella sp. OPT22]|nr:2-amino-4-hydroxy-6-hydroxymethyldihydropteridine diphosphokinase [Shewanella sp. OPT22]